jgi:hypothetical protein
MIVKPAITWLGHVNDAVLRGKISTILISMADHVEIYDNPSPPLAKVQSALDDFVNSILASAVSVCGQNQPGSCG